MGGALILVSILVTTLLWGDLENRFIRTRRDCGDNSIDHVAIDEKVLTKAAFGVAHKYC